MPKVQRPTGPPPTSPAPTERAPAPAANEPASEPAGWKPTAAGRRMPARGSWVPDEPLKDKAYDGFFVGSAAAPIGPRSSFLGVPAVMPSNGKAEGLAIFVNGVLNTRETQAESMEALANSSGMAVIGVHNATRSLALDGLQAAGEKVGLRNPATAPLQAAITESLAKGLPIHLVGHSQGALVVSDALGEVKRSLLDQGLTVAQAEAKLGALVTVETFGGAAARFPDGPRYRHYLNTADPVPSWLGASDTGAALRQRAGAAARAVDNLLGKAGHETKAVEAATLGVVDAVKGYPGRDAVVKRFTDPGGADPMGAHLFKTYLKHREPMK